jgi:hypothetical protein
MLTIQEYDIEYVSTIIKDCLKDNFVKIEFKDLSVNEYPLLLILVFVKDCISFIKFATIFPDECTEIFEYSEWVGYNIKIIMGTKISVKLINTRDLIEK